MNLHQLNPSSTDAAKDVTILLLGETGVGKSTWINGFANFLQFESLTEAEENETVCLIPSSFTVTDENYEERLIATGSDKNEVTDAGQSATQHPQTYSFPNHGRIVRLIDTPGIGDVRGIKQDKKNFELILDHISHLNELDAICILLKPNNARLNILFSFCIKELLTHLHKDACRNIVFCFTNSRSTFYRPGDTLPALRKLLEENKEVQIPLNHSTLYCMDNEAVRFLYALKDGINFTDDERKNYNASWAKSVDEISRLLQHASKQQPHSIKNTLSLNNARQTILALESPLAEVTKNIQINIAAKQRTKDQLTDSEQTKEELSKNLYTEEYATNTKLIEPRTVCTASKCVQLINKGIYEEEIYNTHCHKGCGTGKQKHFKILNRVGHKSIKKCSAFDNKGICKHCKCSWEVHKKITYETTVEKVFVPDTTKKFQIKNSENAIQEIQAFLHKLDEELKELHKEQQEITSVTVEFARFLKSNAITPFNDSMDAYLKHFINQEENKVNLGGDPAVLEGMKKMRQDYNNQMAVLQSAMDNNTIEKAISPADLEKCVRSLYRLKHSGKFLVDMMHKSLDSAKSSYTEKIVVRQESFSASSKLRSNSSKPSKNSIFHHIFLSGPKVISGKKYGMTSQQSARTNPSYTSRPETPKSTPAVAFSTEIQRRPKRQAPPIPNRKDAQIKHPQLKANNSQNQRSISDSFHPTVPARQFNTTEVHATTKCSPPPLKQELTVASKGLQQLQIDKSSLVKEKVDAETQSEDVLTRSNISQVEHGSGKGPLPGYSDLGQVLTHVLEARSRVHHSDNDDDDWE